MGDFLTTASTLLCPHGGHVSVVTGNNRVKASAAFLLRPSDTFVIVGCPFKLPDEEPHPCVRVRWVAHALRSTAAGDATLTRDSVGMCVAADETPQGSAQVVATQPRASGQ